MKGLLLAFIFALLIFSSVGFVSAIVPKQDANLDSCPPEIVNLTTSAKKLNVFDSVNSARPSVTLTEMPNNLMTGYVTDSDGEKYRYRQVIGIGSTISEFSTSQGDVPNPVLNYQVGRDSSFPLYTYSVEFDRSIDLSSPKIQGKKIKILGVDYVIGAGSGDEYVFLSSGNKKIIISDGYAVVMGSNNTIVPGTIGKITLEAPKSVMGFSVSFAMQSSQIDHVALGESFLNPVFGKLSFVFDNANPNLNDTSRGMIKVRTDNNQYGFVTFDSARSGAIGAKEMTYVYDKNTSSVVVSPVLAHQVITSNDRGYIHVKEGEDAKTNDWIVVNQNDSGTILEVTDLSIDSATSGKVSLQDVITGESQTITVTNGTGTNGYYRKNGVNFFGGVGYTIRMNQAGTMVNILWNNGSTVIFPRIKLKNGGWISFLTATKVSDSESIILPNGLTALPLAGSSFGSAGGIGQRKSVIINGVKWTGISESSGKITIDGIVNNTQGSNPVGIGGQIITDKGITLEVAELVIDFPLQGGHAMFRDVATGKTYTVYLSYIGGEYQTYPNTMIGMFGGIYAVKMNSAGTAVNIIWKLGASCDFSTSKGPAVLFFEPKKIGDINYGDFVCIPLTTTGTTEIAIADPAIDGTNEGYVTLTSDTYQKQSVDKYGTFFQKEDRTNQNGVATIKYPSSQMYFNALLTAPCVNPSAIRLAPESCEGFTGWIKRLFGKC